MATKILNAALVALLLLGTLAAAAPGGVVEHALRDHHYHHGHRPNTKKHVSTGASTINVTRCTDGLCSVGCKAGESFPTGKCLPFRFDHRSEKAACLTVPNARCLKLHAFNDSTCSNTDERFEQSLRCGVCSHDFKLGHFTFDGCGANAQSTTLKYQCSDATCGNCTKSKTITIGDCAESVADPHMHIVFKGTFSCEKVIRFQQYEGTDCKKADGFVGEVISGACTGYPRGSVKDTCEDSSFRPATAEELAQPVGVALL